MKAFHYVLFAIVVCLSCSYVRAEEVNAFGSPASAGVVQQYDENDAISFYFERMSLTSDSGSLLHELQLSVARITRRETAVMPSNMVNVTGDFASSFRLLPNGVHFSTPAQITIPYEDFLIPLGYKPTDIHTYYFDEDIAQWKLLERVGVDTLAHTITSLTTHFTDFANAIIKVPEMPESKAFVPTAMVDLPDVNPLQGVPMVQAPTANNRGTAELTYPVEIPKGRHGMQPNVDLHYSSAGGNGILGVGWSIQQPTISVDTRWGVPRFDIKKETEAYLMNGEQIVLHDVNGEPYPLPHQAKEMGFPQRSYGRTQFYARDTKNQDRIIRYGDNLNSYWWVVTDRSGTKFFYGYDPIERDLDTEATICDDAGNISSWALSAVVDIYGNYMRYKYFKDCNVVYLSDIEYTGNLSTHAQPTYAIVLQYDSCRSDVAINGRMGVLQKTKKRLKCITTVYDNSPIFQYLLHYSEGYFSLYKSRLDSITKYDDPCCLECMAYKGPPTIVLEDFSSLDNYVAAHDSSFDSIYSSYLDSVTIDVVPASTTSFSYIDALPISKIYSDSVVINFPAQYSKSQNNSWSIGGTATVGLGEVPVLTSMSLGANYSYNRSTGRVQTVLMDIDGDGLVDIVTEQNNTVLYYKQFTTGSFASTPQVIRGITSLSRDISSSHSFGLQADLGFSDAVSANISYTPSIDNTYTDIYFSDINNDGLPDLITPEGAKMNVLVNGVPSFESLPTTSAAPSIKVNNSSCGYVYRDGAVDERLECVNNWVLDTIVWRYDYLEADYHAEIDRPLTLRYEREVLFEDVVPEKTKEQDPSTEVFYKMWLDNTLVDTSVWEELFPVMLNDSAHYSTHYHLRPEWETADYKVISVGDSLYVYHLETVCDHSSEMPAVDIVKVWVAPTSGSINLHSVIQLQKDTTSSRRESRRADGVKYAIQWNDNLLDSAMIACDNYDSISIDHTLTVEENDVLLFRLSANDDRRFDNTEWVHTIVYSATGQRYNSEEDYVCSGQNNFYAVDAGYVRAGYEYSNGTSSAVSVLVKKNGNLLPSNSLNQWIAVNKGDELQFEAVPTTSSCEPQWSKIHIHPYVDYVANAFSDSILSDTLHYTPDVHISCSSILADTSSYRELFGLLHRGWGQFAYNNEAHDDIILLSSLNNSESQNANNLLNDSARLQTQFMQIDTMALSNHHDSEELPDSLLSLINTIGAYDPLHTENKWIAMHADSKTETWQAYGNLGCIGARLHTTSASISVPDVNGNANVNPNVADIEYDSSIPVSAEGIAVTTIRKRSFSVQHSISAGVSLAAGSLNKNVSFGSNDVKTDYMDMNGDGFPDFIGETSIQYSLPWGGVGEAVEPNRVQSVHNQTFSDGNGFSGGKNVWGRITNNSPKRFNVYNASLGGGAGTSHTLNHANRSYVDINGDGLPDIVDVKKDSVWYNLGYSFSEAEAINSAFVINEGLSSNMSLSGNLSTGANFYKSAQDIVQELYDQGGELDAILKRFKDYSMCQYSISGGISTSGSLNETLAQMIDINGDGQLDNIWRNANTQMVRFGNNGEFIANDSALFSHQILSQTSNFGANISLTAGFSLSVIPVKFCFGVQSSPWAISTTVGESGFTDINGDGFIDFVYASPFAEGAMTVLYNQNGSRPINLLKTVINPTGQEIWINYQQTTPSVEHRGRSWNLSEVNDRITALDDTKHNYTRIHNNGAYYDNFEKEDYGCEEMVTVYSEEKILREFYSNKKFISRGEKVCDMLERVQDGMVYLAHSHEIRYVDAGGNRVYDTCNDAAVYVDLEGFFTDYYDENGNRITTYYSLTYDRLHNLVKYSDDGDIAVQGDEWEQMIEYANSASNGWRYNLISLPTKEIVRSLSGDTLRYSTCYYNRLGSPEWIIKENTATTSRASTFLEYDRYGNIARASLPEYDVDTNRRPWIAYNYDNVTHTYPVFITNQFGEEQRSSYNYLFGLPTLVTDPAGYGIIYDYDRQGRLSQVIAPGELFAHAPFSIRYYYVLPHHNKAFSSGAKNPYVLKVSLADGVPTAESSLYDQRGKAVQKRTLFEINGTLQWATDGLRICDAFYRPLEVFPSFTTTAPMDEVDNNTAGYATLYNYDVLNRLRHVLNPDSSRRIIDYTFSRDFNNYFRLTTTETDENMVTTSILKSPQDWTIQTFAGDGSKTSYEYNSIGELLHVIDADINETFYRYDMFGNCIERRHPDAGITRWTYAPMGNILAKEDAVLRTFGSSVEYEYDYNHLKAIHYPFHPENDVHYTYDYAGRISKREDGVGYEQFTYDELGNVAQSFRRIVVPNEYYAYVFNTNYEYDSFGRMRNIVYPDGESVRYKYAIGGVLKKIDGVKGNQHNIYLQNRLYDEQGRKIYQEYGNEVYTTYTYSPSRQWLSHMYTELPNGTVIQDLCYKYDSVGNLCQIQQYAPTGTSVSLGGQYNNIYTYDRQYRLIASTCNNGIPYDFAASYSRAGKLCTKYTSTNNWRSDLKFQYNPRQHSHQPRTIYDSFSGNIDCYWDLNGNMAQAVSCNRSAARIHEWDEENRLRFMMGVKSAGYYGYDGNGERVYKLTGVSGIDEINGSGRSAFVYLDDAVLYPNPYIVFTPRGYTKHYYAGTERLATVIGTGGINTYFNEPQLDEFSKDEEIKGAFYGNYFKRNDPFRHEATFRTHQDSDDEDVHLLKHCSPIILHDIEVRADSNILMDAIKSAVDIKDEEKEIFYYHGDHLGSASWITDYAGDAIQYLHYAPYGELIENQQASGYDERYKFTGKERDWESGYDYFGARFLWSNIGIWLSVDPLVDKYLWISPYAYCANNPVKFVDPDGRYFTKYHAAKASRYTGFLRKKYEKAKSDVDKENIARHIRGIGDMKKDTENEYRFLWRPLKKSMTRGHGRNKDGKVIVEMIYSRETKPNEVTHGEQNAQGKIKCNENGTVEGYDLGDELEAYQNQISVSGALYVGIYNDELKIAVPREFQTSSDITIEDVKRISEDPWGESMPYKDLPNPTE